MGLSKLRLFQLLALATTVLAAGCTRDATAVPGASISPAPAYRAVARGRVDVEGGQLPLTMPVEATLAEVRVHEGDQVSRGQVLAVADATEVRLQQEMAQARLDAARRQEHGLQVRIATARKRAERLVSAASAGAADGQGADDARDAINQLIAERDAARGAEAVARNEIEQAKNLQARHVLRAPVDAEVVRVSAQAGMSVSPQSPALVTLLPHRPHFIRAELGAG